MMLFCLFACHRCDAAVCCSPLAAGLPACSNRLWSKAIRNPLHGLPELRAHALRAVTSAAVSSEQCRVVIVQAYLKGKEGGHAERSQ